MIEIKNTVDKEEKVAIVKKFNAHNLYYLLEDKSPIAVSAAEADMMGHYYHGPYIFRVNERDLEKALNLLNELVSESNQAKPLNSKKTSFLSALISDLKLFFNWLYK